MIELRISLDENTDATLHVSALPASGEILQLGAGAVKISTVIAHNVVGGRRIAWAKGLRVAWSGSHLVRVDRLQPIRLRLTLPRGDVIEIPVERQGFGKNWRPVAGDNIIDPASGTAYTLTGVERMTDGVIHATGVRYAPAPTAAPLVQVGAVQTRGTP